jgi:hypothetical protein
MRHARHQQKPALDLGVPRGAVRGAIVETQAWLNAPIWFPMCSGSAAAAPQQPQQEPDAMLLDLGGDAEQQPLQQPAGAAPPAGGCIVQRLHSLSRSLKAATPYPAKLLYNTAEMLVICMICT